MTPQQILDTYPALTAGQCCTILGLYRRNGDVNRRAFYDLVDNGDIDVIDPDQPRVRQRVSNVEMRRYLSEGSRRSQPGGQHEHRP